MDTNNSFLGTGWSFPPTFNQNTGTVEMVSDESDIIQSLEIILSTRPAERIMQPDFGCELSQFLFEEISQGLITGIRGIISDALVYHEPRINVEEINIEESEQEGLLLISIIYTVRATNSRYNLVYPFYINEAQISG
ncbi:MAG: GPW/gp25 family protein [Okeania sp. SIO2G4]|uniref:GPW/gp25 family protein n=1 Tax=unclassified Okeania TaxID=2634635 RepID=UPI0013BB28AA|nr:MULTISPECIES: GPW/gp25 family protein [unclassified Okeania]NEP42107.1 GPW/gp25 family protein [Okeania sp. SIO2H7]NEP73990.1 GPW/gp25 family protein [Okeania sp. SIO2G5]NEP92608.1 GPW/gp25 family protein [Okeania sp. SIO2F5]NEQ90063.1 GPW/gp25 family protein [Okeania sp. SIO2G4]